MPQLTARQRFEDARAAVLRLRDVQLMIMNRCEDWRPPTARARGARPDPTASAAAYNVDELEGRLAALRAEEAELLGEIGRALAVVQAVRAGLGAKFADVLEWRYVDCMSWARIEEDFGVAKTTGAYRLDVAFDWVDSVGLVNLAAGNFEL